MGETLNIKDRVWTRCGKDAAWEIAVGARAFPAATLANSLAPFSIEQVLSASELPEEEISGVPVRVIACEVDANAFAGKARVGVRGKEALRQSRVTRTFWVGKEDNVIHRMVELVEVPKTGSESCLYLQGDHPDSALGVVPLHLSRPERLAAFASFPAPSETLQEGKVGGC